MKTSESREDGVKDLYDSERKAMRNIAYQLRLKHSFRGVKTIDQEDAIKRAFELEARNRCAEVGLIVGVQWDADVSDDPADQNLYWVPRIIVEGRTDKISEYDHDKQQFEVRKGILDGKEGVLDPNDPGKLKEPKKKNIF